MTKKTKAKTIDTLGMITSGICAVHCAALPILFSLGIIGGTSGAAHSSVESLVVLFSIGLGIWSMYQAFMSHRRLLPQALIMSGLAMILFGFFALVPANHNLMALGGLILVSGHWLNRKFIQKVVIQ